MTRNLFAHSGDLGDAIAALPTIKALGGGDIVFVPHDGKNQGRETLRGTRYNALLPLLQAQPYVGKVEWREKLPEGVTHDFRQFRDCFVSGTENLMDWQARHLGLTVSTEPWLTARRSGETIGRAVFARSTRYQNPGFPWFAALAKHRDALFVGSAEEHAAFCKQHGSNIAFRATENLLELAEVINGGALFIGNQSCPFWIAAGLGVNLIQEGWRHSPNSQVHRKNTRYLVNGPFLL